MLLLVVVPAVKSNCKIVLLKSSVVLLLLLLLLLPGRSSNVMPINAGLFVVSATLNNGSTVACFPLKLDCCFNVKSRRCSAYAAGGIFNVVNAKERAESAFRLAVLRCQYVEPKPAATASTMKTPTTMPVELSSFVVLSSGSDTFTNVVVVMVAVAVVDVSVVAEVVVVENVVVDNVVVLMVVVVVEIVVVVPVVDVVHAPHITGQMSDTSFSPRFFPNFLKQSFLSIFSQ